MKHILIIIAISVALLSSCDGFEISHNGDLDGMWHLVEVDSLSNGKVVDYVHNGIYWSFQSNLLQVDDREFVYPSQLLRFEHKNSSLSVSDPYRYDRENGDIKTVDEKELAPFGINGLIDSFKVEQLSKSQMTLRGSLLLLKFRKY